MSLDFAEHTDTIDTVDVAVQRGWQVLVVSDLHLRALSDDASESITTDLARRIDSWVGPGVVILGGDTFELTEEPKNSPQRALTAHPRLAEALRRFTLGVDRRLVVLAGDHDARLLDNANDRRELCAIDALVGARGDLSVDTGAGVELVRIEHCTASLTGLAGEVSDEQRDSSRRFYASLRHVWWIPTIVPILAVLIGIIVAANVTDDTNSIHHITPLRSLYFVCSTISVQIVMTALMLAAIKRRSGNRPPTGAVGDSPIDCNRVDRARAADTAVDGVDGFVGAGSHSPELIDLGDCWYANAGCAVRHLTSRAARFGLPPIYAQSNELSWIELEAGATLHVSVVASRRDDRPDSWIERLAAKSRLDIPPMPTRVARLEAGTVWPTPTDPFRSTTQTRRRGALGLLSIGVVDLLSALTPPLRDRLHAIRQVIPVGTPAVAAGLVAAAGVGLVMLATGLRRGRRLAWQLGLTLLLVSAIGHLVKGFDIEEATLAGLLAAWLALHRQAFTAPAGEGRLRRAALVAASGLLVIGLVAAAWISVGGHRSIGQGLSIAFERMIGLPSAPLPRHQKLLVSALPALAIAAVFVIGWYVLRSRRAPADDPQTTARTWEIVRQHGRGTLDYFALRDDKRHYICEDTVVAYTVANGTAIVSPDPVGPPDQRNRAWMGFRAFAATNGWHVAALGAGSAWLPVYRSSGMWAMYIGDESVVDVQRFNLDGGRNKSLRKAVNRVAKAGYTVEFHDPAHIDPLLASDLRELATQSRQGSVERGFSMTLSRLFDPRDQGLLLAVARDADGRPAAFCQFVPAAGIDGYSLDLMRRGDAARKGTTTKSAAGHLAGDAPAGHQVSGEGLSGEGLSGEGLSGKGDHADDGAARSGHPNGLTEFVVVRTIEYLRAEGRHGLGLHFATMRALLAGQTGSRLWHRAIAELMHRMSDDMQIESLWKFNAKFDPTWLPRYVVIDTPGSTLFAGLAIARVESLWELPVIGRFMRPAADTLAPSRKDASPGKSGG